MVLDKNKEAYCLECGDKITEKVIAKHQDICDKCVKRINDEEDEERAIGWEKYCNEHPKEC